MKAIALMSGGLDSNLAVKMLHNEGIEIIGVHFTGPFCTCNRGSGGCIHYARKEAEDLGLKFVTLGLGSAYLDIVKNPKHGYGSGINPCIDCRIMMFSRARQMMEEEGASFVITGEVLGQRPMSQLSNKLKIIERESGLEGLIVRPLSAKVLPETIPEKNGWVDREKMQGIEGRKRREQMDLAEALEIGDYPCPAGGCLLTDKHFARRAREHMSRCDFLMEDIGLLKVGRHFRLPDGAKLVVGRNEEENGKLEVILRDGDMLFIPEGVMGPSALLRGGEHKDETLRLAGEIVASYCDGEGAVNIEHRTSTAERRTDASCFMECNRRPREDFSEYSV